MNHTNFLAASSIEYMSKDCPEGWTRDLWFRFPQNNTNWIEEDPCTIHGIAFFVFLCVSMTVFVMTIVLSFVSLLFQRKTLPRFHLGLNFVHAAAGFAFCYCTIAREDFNQAWQDTPAWGFWASWAVYNTTILAHCLIMADTISNLSNSLNPATKAVDKNAMRRIMESSTTQRVALVVAGVETTLLLGVYLMIPWAKGPTPDVPHWNQALDLRAVSRKDFWWFLACAFNLTATITFVIFPIRNHFRIWRYVRETRLGIESTLKQRRDSAYADSPDNVWPGDEVKNDDNIMGSPSMGQRRATGTKKGRRISSVEASPLSDDTKSPTLNPRSSSVSAQPIFKPNTTRVSMTKRKKTDAELQRVQMRMFEDKARNSFFIGIFVGITSVFMWILMCHESVLGPRVYLMAFQMSLGWFFQFSVVHLYFPKIALHKRFVSMLPEHLQVRIDGVPDPVVAPSVRMRTSKRPSVINERRVSNRNKVPESEIPIPKALVAPIEELAPDKLELNEPLVPSVPLAEDGEIVVVGDGAQPDQEKQVHPESEPATAVVREDEKEKSNEEVVPKDDRKSTSRASQASAAAKPLSEAHAEEAEIEPKSYNPRESEAEPVSYNPAADTVSVRTSFTSPPPI